MITSDNNDSNENNKQKAITIIEPQTTPQQTENTRDSFQPPGSFDTQKNNINNNNDNNINNNNTTASNSELALYSKNDGTVEFIHSDFDLIEEIGRGSSGIVERVKHRPTGRIIARKMIRLEVKPAVRKQICTELRLLHECKSQFIVEFYGSYIVDKNVAICMEYMDGGSLDMLCLRQGLNVGLAENILMVITLGILRALNDLRENHNILHRDVKPSNVLLNSNGDVKMCDFGVSGELINSQVDSFVGTKSYMSPERLAGAPYTVKSDVWSLGLSLIEIATGRFPIPPSEEDGGSSSGSSSGSNSGSGSHSNTSDSEEDDDKSSGNNTNIKQTYQRPAGMAFLELLQYIVNEDPPQLPSKQFSSEACDFVHLSLLKDASQRADLKTLLNHKWMNMAMANENKVHIGKWVSDCLKKPLPSPSVLY